QPCPSAAPPGVAATSGSRPASGTSRAARPLFGGRVWAFRPGRLLRPRLVEFIQPCVYQPNPPLALRDVDVVPDVAAVADSLEQGALPTRHRVPQRGDHLADGRHRDAESLGRVIT